MVRSHPLALAARLTAFGLSALVLAPSAHAQETAPRGGREITVETDPEFPVVGLSLSAVVRFATLRPQTVTVFLRPVGTETYERLTATPTGAPGEFSVEIQREIPIQGIEVYAEYIVDGTTLTEPEQNPEDRPFRIPTLFPVAVSDIALPARQYRMITIPLFLQSQLPEGTTVEDLGSDEPDDVFGDDFGEGADPSRWRLLKFDPGLNASRDYAEDPAGFGPVRPAEGYWIVTAAGGTFDVDAGLSNGVTFDGNRPFAAPVTVLLGPGWNQIGNPFLLPFEWDDVVQSGLVEDPVAFRESYEPAQSTLNPWEGYFVFNRGEASTLTFDALPGSTNQPTRAAEAPADRLVRRAGPGGYVLSLRAESGGRTDQAYLGLYGAGAEAGNRLDMQKPPPIDDGLRVVVRDEGRSLAGSFRPSVGAQTWTVEIAPGDAGRAGVSLALGEFGTRPKGMSLSVYDLDRGVPLPVVGGRVKVSDLAGTATRTVQIRLDGNGDGLEGVTLGRPYPTPAVGDVTVPYLVSSAGPVRLDVYDVLGRLVRVLHDGPLDAGAYESVWTGTDASGGRVAAGAYLVRLSTPTASSVARVAVLR